MMKDKANQLTTATLAALALLLGACGNEETATPQGEDAAQSSRPETAESSSGADAAGSSGTDTADSPSSAGTIASLSKEAAGQMNAMVETFSSVENQATAKAAATKIEQIATRMEEIAEQFEALDEPSEEDRKLVADTIGKARQALAEKMATKEEFSAENPVAAMILIRPFSRFDSAMEKFEKAMERYQTGQDPA